MRAAMVFLAVALVLVGPALVLLAAALGDEGGR